MRETLVTDFIQRLKDDSDETLFKGVDSVYQESEAVGLLALESACKDSGDLEEDKTLILHARKAVDDLIRKLEGQKRLFPSDYERLDDLERWRDKLKDVFIDLDLPLSARNTKKRTSKPRSTRKKTKNLSELGADQKELINAAKSLQKIFDPSDLERADFITKGVKNPVSLEILKTLAAQEDLWDILTGYDPNGHFYVGVFMPNNINGLPPVEIYERLKRIAKKMQSIIDSEPKTLGYSMPLTSLVLLLDRLEKAGLEDSSS